MKEEKNNIITYYQYRNKMKLLCEEKNESKRKYTVFSIIKTVKLIRALKPHKTENYLNKQSHSA